MGCEEPERRISPTAQTWHDLHVKTVAAHGNDTDLPLKLVREVASTSCGMESTYEQNAGHWDVVKKEKKIEGRL